jgi:hypothetical protein
MTLEISGKHIELPTMTIELPIFGTTPVRRTEEQCNCRTKRRLFKEMFAARCLYGQPDLS